MITRILFSFILTVSMISSAWADTPALRVAVLKFGTVNWELDTIKRHNLDGANGISLQVQGMAGGSAAKIAFQGGEADIIVSDWLWVARQRAAGKDFVFIPYSKAVGGMVVAEDSPAQSLADLKGSKIGIAGGPLDKSWLILRAFAMQSANLDLAEQTKQVYGAPPLIFKSAVSGEVDAAINFWHFMAKMEASGMRKLVDIAVAAKALGLDPETPMLGYVIKGEMLRDNPDAIKGFAAASRAAKTMLASDDAEWDRLRPRMNANTDAQFDALKAGFRAGIPADQPIDEAAADKMLKLMVKLGGEKLLGQATEVPQGTFYSSGN
jgi:NitT/TauT family transport system substrate-binding protein